MTAMGHEGRSARLHARGGLLLTALVALVAGAVGAGLGATFILDRRASDIGGLHAIVHEGLDLSSEQRTALAEIEVGFAERRTALEANLQQANSDLAAAIGAYSNYTPEVDEAVSRVDTAMGDLQRATVHHVYDMRAILDDRQAAVFDDRVARALTAPAD